MKSEYQNRIPDVIDEFFSNPGGRSLIIKGAPGTGKTTFAVEVLNSYTRQQKVCYISSRVEEQTLKGHIPWLDFKILLRKGSMEEASNPIQIDRSELNKLEARVEDGDEYLDEPYDPEMGTGIIDGTSITFDLSMLLPEIDKLYDTVELSLPNRTLVAIDSLEGLHEKYGISGRRIFQTLQKDLVERTNVNLIVIMEREERSDLDFLGDGVIILDMDEIEGRRLRSMKIQKLRGVPILSPSVPFTLDDGHFSVLDNKPVDGKMKYRMAFKDILSGILKEGAYTLIEINPDVPINIVNDLAYTLVESSLLASRGTYAFSSIRLFGNRIDETLKEFDLEGNHAANLKLLNPLSFYNENATSGHSVMIDGEAITEDLKWEFINGLLSESEGPHTLLLDFNMVESLYGSECVTDLESHISTLIQNNGTGIGFVWKTPGAKDMSFGFSDSVIKIMQIGQQTVFYGIKPFSPLYVLNCDENSKALDLRLMI
jgi:KaiC/GvpD/RAD55 family RecA-like ATPase